MYAWCTWRQAKKGGTVGSKFRESLSALTTAIERSHALFVRCIKPNEHCQPVTFDATKVHTCHRGVYHPACLPAHPPVHAQVAAQMRGFGILQTIAVRRAGYSAVLTMYVPHT